MTSPEPEGDKEKQQQLLHGYRQMLQRVKTAVDDWQSDVRPKLQELVTRAQEKAVELGELSEEEATTLAKYLQRDLHDIAHFMVDAEEVIAEQVYFDWHAVEDKLLNAFLVLADKTTVELYDLQLQAAQSSIYRTGEIIGIGTLQCQQCQQILQFAKVSHIPPCPQCHGSSFVRLPEPSECQ